MSFESFMVGFGWLSALLFVGVSGYKIITLARLPMNVRWEVYPIPHEAESKRHYGGSYMEDVDWAKNTRRGSMLPAYLEMAFEIVTLRKVKANNPYNIWPLSLAMHWGIYLYFGWLLLLVVDNVLNAGVLWALTTVVGLAAVLLGAAGALALVVKRAANPDLSAYTTPLDYFNLFFLASFFVMGLVSWLNSFSFAPHAAYIASVLSLEPAPLPLTVSAHFLLFELFMIYMPFTKLIHYFAKYLTFDLTLWSDDFKAKGSSTDKKVIEQLGYGMTWGAPHIQPGKTWLEQAQTTAIQGGKK